MKLQLRDDTKKTPTPWQELEPGELFSDEADCINMVVWRDHDAQEKGLIYWTSDHGPIIADKRTRDVTEVIGRHTMADLEFVD